jgi:uncharacterized protein YdhG (YjbR/CyaY superfamily)
VSAEEIDQYLDALEEPKRTTLARLRQTILDVLPEADQGNSYGVPAFKVRGKTIASNRRHSAGSSRRDMAEQRHQGLQRDVGV